MAFKEVLSLETDVTVTIGGFDKKKNKANPTSIEGYYVGTRGGIPNKFNPEKPNCIHVLQTQKGLVGVWGKTNLDRKMEGQTAGQMVRITFTGTKPSNKGNDMLCYKVEVDATNTIEVPAYESASSSADDSGSYSEDDYAEESPLGEEEESQDVAPPVRAQPPRKPASAPDAARQAKVQALLNGSRSKSSA